MNMYKPENQYRCTIIRGKSQNDMEDLLPLYANMVHTICPIEEEAFKQASYRILSRALFNTTAWEKLSDSNLKTVQNHLTEIAGTLLGLYFPKKDEHGTTYIYESESCKYLVEHNDYPTFFKNLCLNFQFPNGAKWISFIKEDIRNKINIKPFCYLITLLYFAQAKKVLLTKQEIGYYVLNNLDVLQGNVDYETVYNQIIVDRKNKVKRNRLSGSHDWQHIKEQFNLLELANLIETDATYIWLNKNEERSISIFIENLNSFNFTPYAYNLTKKEEREKYFADWKETYGKFNKELLAIKTTFTSTIADRTEMKAQTGATKTSTDLGDEGEALVFKLEQERVRQYKERLVNKVLLLGKTKGLGYDISSVEADENPQRPEFARYIEVKTTTRITEPDFGKQWYDAVKLTAKEWIAAEQYKEYYNIYRVYFTKKKTIIVKLNNPYQKYEDGKVEVYPLIYQLEFNASTIDKQYAI